MGLNKLNHKRSGATSLLIVVGLALLFVGIITGLTSLTVREQQQAGDTDQSNRAVQAAEASAREAAEKLVSFPDTQLTDCNSAAVNGLVSHGPPSNQPAGSDLEIICRTIKSVSDNISGSLNKDQDAQIMMTIDDVKAVNLRWSKKGSVSLANLPCLFPPSASSPGACSYPNSAASTMEVTFFIWPKSINSTFLSGVDSSGIKTKTYILVPGASGASNSKADSNVQTNPTTSCNTSFVDFQCAANLDVSSLSGYDPANFRYAMRLTSRYKATDFNTRFFKDVAQSQPAQVRSSEAEIDVTARSGNLYRRIRAYKPIGNLSILDSALGSGREICKNMTVTPSPNRTVVRNNCNGFY